MQRDRSRLVVVRSEVWVEGKEVTANEYRAFGGSETNILKFIVVIVSQLL